MKTFVIDTNVLLLDPEAILKFPANRVVIPVTVLEELDAKKHQRDELGANARAAARLLASLKDVGEGDLHQGVEIENGSVIRVQLGLKTDLSPALGLAVRGNRILMAAYLLHDQGERVVFVSRNFAARVKAEALGIEAQDYENLKVSYRELHKGVCELEVTKSQIDHFFKDGSIPLDGVDLLTNEFCMLNAPENSTAIGRWNGEEGRLKALAASPKDVWGVKPLNLQQRCAFDLLLRPEVQLVSLVGQAGTGKTLLALACGLRQCFDDATYAKILVSRPIVPMGKDIGYLPGTKEEKLLHWMQPIYDNLEFVCGATTGDSTGETLRWVLDSDKLEMEAFTYIRGRSLPKLYFIIDEAQNLTPHEIKTIISRAGHGTKVVLTGDPTQIDNPYLDKDSNGLTYTVGKFRSHAVFGHVFLDKTERSHLAALAAEVM